LRLSFGQIREAGYGSQGMLLVITSVLAAGNIYILAPVDKFDVVKIVLMWSLLAHYRAETGLGLFPLKFHFIGLLGHEKLLN